MMTNTTTATTANDDLYGFRFAEPGKQMRTFCRMHIDQNRPMAGRYALALGRAHMEQVATNLRARGYRVVLVPAAELRGRVMTVNGWLR